MLDGSAQAYFEKLFWTMALLLPIMNPLGMAPIFLNLTLGAPDHVRRGIALRVARYSFIMLIVAMLTGSLVLRFFGISLFVVQVAGGMLVIATGWAMVNRPDTQTQESTKIAEHFTPEFVRQRAFYPMTFPLTCGVGSLSTSITVGTSMPDPERNIFIANLLGAVSGMLVTSVVIYLCYRFAMTILKPLGETGVSVLMRLMAFILLCLGVKILWTGLTGLITHTFLEPAALPLALL